MGFRIVKINSRCKLETQLNYLVCRKETETRILLDEISLLIIENQQVCMTQALMTELIRHKVRVIFCDEKHNPNAEVMPYASSYDSFAKIKQQVEWSQETKDLVWERIVKMKIENQALLLKSLSHEQEYQHLTKYKDEVIAGDSTNREGLAAKMYFATLFGNNFDRRKSKDIRNVYLDYGYSIILGSINREIASFGYLLQFGIHHIGKENPFNFGCDLMEPFRPFVDYVVLKKKITEDNYKSLLLEVPTWEVQCQDKVMIMSNAMHQYVLSVIAALSNRSIININRISFLHEQL